MTWLNHLFKRNVPIKILALFAAIILWLYVMNEQNPSVDTTFTRDVSILNVPSGYHVRHDLERVRLKVRALRSHFVGSAPDTFKAFVDLSPSIEGENRLPIKASLPPGFELVSATPSEAVITLDPIIEKTLAINYVITGTPATSATFAGMKPETNVVEAKGPKMDITRIAQIIGYVALTNREEDFTANVSFNAIDINGKNIDEIKLAPTEGKVAVQLARGLSKKIITVSPQIIGVLPAEYKIESITINPAKIEVAGTIAIIDRVQAINTEPINLSRLTPENLANGIGEFTVKLNPIEGLTITTETVKVEMVLQKKKDNA